MHSIVETENASFDHVPNCKREQCSSLRLLRRIGNEVEPQDLLVYLFQRGVSSHRKADHGDNDPRDPARELVDVSAIDVTEPPTVERRGP